MFIPRLQHGFYRKKRLESWHWSCWLSLIPFAVGNDDEIVVDAEHRRCFRKMIFKMQAVVQPMYVRENFSSKELEDIDRAVHNWRYYFHKHFKTSLPTECCHPNFHMVRALATYCMYGLLHVLLAFFTYYLTLTQFSGHRYARIICFLHVLLNPNPIFSHKYARIICLLRVLLACCTFYVFILNFFFLCHR